MDPNPRDLRPSFVHQIVAGQSAPSLETIAEAADILEEHGNVEHVRCLAFALKRAAAFEFDVMSSLFKLLYCCRRLGPMAAVGSNSYALRAYRELEEVLSGASGEEHSCDPEDLRRMLLVQLVVPIENWDFADTIVKRLQEAPFTELLEDESVPCREIARQVLDSVFKDSPSGG